MINKQECCKINGNNFIINAEGDFIYNEEDKVISINEDI